MSMAPSSGLTWEDFLNLPDEDRYRHAELIDGELILANPPVTTAATCPTWPGSARSAPAPPPGTRT
jgi:Uma2 family endonuclease